jgi:hypothetical protein
MSDSDLGRKLLDRVELDLLPPLHTTLGRRVISYSGRGRGLVASYAVPQRASPIDALGEQERIVLRDASTRGCLLSLSRILWEDPYLVVVPYRAALADEWRWRVEGAEADVGELYDYATEEEALVEAVIEGRQRQTDARGGP